ncbi:MAG: hypothetical protein II508_07040, partial [Acholeplasmatales bacterium]|nr:hypothetical protein [Acholeplasmatales bacterium]
YMTILAIVLCLAKTGLAGFLSGLAFKLLFKKNYYVAIYAAAIIAPIVNTGTFLLLYGVLIYIMTGSAYGPTFVATAAAVWIVFLVELAVNILFAPALATLTKTLTRNYDLGFVDYLKKYSSENSLDEAVDTEEIVEA